jgi:hypothetical protein
MAFNGVLTKSGSMTTEETQLELKALREEFHSYRMQWDTMGNVIWCSAVFFLAAGLATYGIGLWLTKTHDIVPSIMLFALSLTQFLVSQALRIPHRKSAAAPVRQRSGSMIAKGDVR